jgi:hypothetical protein
MDAARQPPCAVAATTSGSKPERWQHSGGWLSTPTTRPSAYSLSDLAVDRCITKAPCGGEKAGKNPRRRGQIRHQHTVVDAKGIPLGAVVAPANRHDLPLLDETLDTLEVLGELPEQMSVHLDRGYDSRSTRGKLKGRSLFAVISG